MSTTSERASVTLIDFLLARIAEDEAEWVEAEQHEDYGVRMIRFLFATSAAMRQIVESLAQEEWFMLTLAAIYADHPDYRDEWRV